MPDDPMAGSTKSAAPLLRMLRESLGAGLRLAGFLPVSPARFAPSAELWLALILLDLTLLFLVGFARVGTTGIFDVTSLPRALVYVPLALAAGVASARIAGDATLSLRVPVAAQALSVVLTPTALVVDALASVPSITLRWPNAYYFGAYGTFAWWSLALCVTIARLVPAAMLARLRAVTYGAFLLVLPGYWLPAPSLWVRPYDPGASALPDPGVMAEENFYAQPELLARELNALLPSRPGVPDVYVLTAALYASEDVFMKEVEVITDLLRSRYDAHGRTISLVNHPKRAGEQPIASLTSVRRALEAIGERMNLDEDVLVLYLTSHGSERHRLSVTNWPLKLEEIDPATLRAALDGAGIRWRVVIVSACYSGGFVKPLEDERTLIITAASAERQSFGCGAGSDFTYLAKALFDEELRNTLSFEQAFVRAKESIAKRERAQGFKPSEPQIFVGPAIREKLMTLEDRLVTAPR